MPGWRGSRWNCMSLWCFISPGSSPTLALWPSKHQHMDHWPYELTFVILYWIIIENAQPGDHTGRKSLGYSSKFRNGHSDTIYMCWQAIPAIHKSRSRINSRHTSRSNDTQSIQRCNRQNGVLLHTTWFTWERSMTRGHSILAHCFKLNLNASKSTHTQWEKIHHVLLQLWRQKLGCVDTETMSGSYQKMQYTIFSKPSFRAHMP